MKSNTSITLIFLTALFSSGTLGAESPELLSSFRGIANQFVYEAGKRTIPIKLDIPVNHWAVNCARDRAIIWGQDLSQARIGAPPVTKVYIIDLKRGKPINHYTGTRGPYEAAFSRDQKMAIVGDDVVDLATGKLVNVIDDMKLDVETCPFFPGKQSN
ncbi:hypothetical protein [Herbaspirillum seropedicae]|uniref:hypothetical protein n=1 Tax=Herbaspirillum seropedicae TaxID=964 RepID=UPI0008480EC9|nr:hypothetical protein [Herbaspirillum seropedicae]AON53041.1 hypothetical protein Hsc_0735 [Herbaspirillum seropedicae]